MQFTLILKLNSVACSTGYKFFAIYKFSADTSFSSPPIHTLTHIAFSERKRERGTRRETEGFPASYSSESEKHREFSGKDEAEGREERRPSRLGQGPSRPSRLGEESEIREETVEIRGLA